ncbi:hypothetical protein B0H15DRAFT_171359 [Mycena belliarum]|uniref:Uncharacterized protein n=1 Tax=Mycena belliarum TaxID=1033014 RepID=A0AAD6XTV4_9AGAR|nr:hypothetical protein B0H15DRAFT_171359 [Mycena belliae]
MLVLRVWILCGKTRRMSYILFPMLLAEFVSMYSKACAFCVRTSKITLRLVIVLLPTTYLTEFIHLGATLPGCYFITPVMRGPYFAFYAFPPLLVTFTVFMLTIYKCIKALRSDISADMPIITLILRDGIIWFIVVFGVDGTQMLVWATGRATLTQVLIIPSLVLYSLVASRVLLNTRSLSKSKECDEDQESESLLPRSPSKRD